MSRTVAVIPLATRSQGEPRIVATGALANGKERGFMGTEEYVCGGGVGVCVPHPVQCVFSQI